MSAQIGLEQGGWSASAQLSAEEKARRAWVRREHKRTGVAWRWRRSAKWSYWMACGTQQKTTHDRRIASNESKSTSTISQSVTDKTDSKRVAATEAWRSGCVAWQSSKGYVVRDGSGD